MEQMNDQRFDVEAQHAAEAIAIYMAVTGKGEAAYSREKSRTKWERAAIAASNMRRKHPHSAVQTLSQIGAVAACFGRDWPEVPGEPEILRRVKWAARQLQAARALPAPENVREGDPYDNPAFEELARTMGVWGTAQAALCAQFFLAGRGAVPAGMEPVAWIEHDEGGVAYMPYYDAARKLPGRVKFDLFTAAQMLAMGRVPPGWQAVPVEPSSEMVEAGVEDLHLRGYEHALIVGAVEVWRAMLAAAPRPPAAQEGA